MIHCPTNCSGIYPQVKPKKHSQKLHVQQTQHLLLKVKQQQPFPFLMSYTDPFFFLASSSVPFPFFMSSSSPFPLFMKQCYWIYLPTMCLIKSWGDEMHYPNKDRKHLRWQQEGKSAMKQGMENLTAIPQHLWCMAAGCQPRHLQYVYT